MLHVTGERAVLEHSEWAKYDKSWQGIVPWDCSGCMGYWSQAEMGIGTVSHANTPHVQRHTHTHTRILTITISIYYINTTRISAL